MAGDENTIFKQSYYAHDYKGKENEFLNKKYYDMIFKNEDESPIGVYWLSCRYVHLREASCDFGLCRVNSGENNYYLNGHSVGNSGGGVGSPISSLRPVISINLQSSGYKLVKIDNTQYMLTDSEE